MIDNALAPTRARLTDEGLLSTPGYGLAAFTVPRCDRYLLRNHAAPGGAPTATRHE